MRWGYKTVHYPLKKEGLLGTAFLDEAEIEISLNEYGKAGWELVSLLETVDGLTAVFKQPLSLEDDFTPAALERPVAAKKAIVEEERESEMVIDDIEPERDASLEEQKIIPVSSRLGKTPRTLDKTVVQPMNIDSIRIE